MSRTILLDGAQWRVWMDDLPPEGGRARAEGTGHAAPRKCLRFAPVSGPGDARHDRDYADPEPYDADVGPFDLSEEFLQGRLRELLRPPR
jgi:hypothetical protein